jgi:RimJ/RimL family protein N-acetyltransferase
MIDLAGKLLREVSFEQFELFLDSLDEELKTWSLDLQSLKNCREFYDSAWMVNEVSKTITSPGPSMIPCLVILHENKIISLISGWRMGTESELVEVSFVVKKDYQGMGIGTRMLIEMENLLSMRTNWKQICGKHFKDNIASHKAFLKAGYRSAVVEGSDDNLSWKLKDIK